MAVLLDIKTFDSVVLDTTNVAYIAENFSYLVKNLIDFVDPKLANAHAKYPEIVGGKRRVVRAVRGPQNGYQYNLDIGKFKTKSGGTRVIDAFGTPILIEEWEVSHPHVVDSDLGETYPTQDSNGDPRGPYTCKMTARVSLEKKTPTRCYVQCNCKDFQTTFYEKLNQQGYTNAQSLPASKGIKTQAPAMCKHLYAIYSQHYIQLVGGIEHGSVDQSPVLFGAPDTTGLQTPIVPPTAPVQEWPVANSKQEALAIISKKLQQEYNKIKNNPDAYFDTRSKSAGGGTYHKYPFSVILLNGNLRAIAYRNKTLAPAGNNNSPVKLLIIDNNPKVWRFIKFAADHQKLWDMIKALGEMPEAIKNRLKAEGKKEPIFDDTVYNLTDLTYLSENSSSAILTSMSELN